MLKLDQRGDALWAESCIGPNAIGPAQLEAIGEGRFRGFGTDEFNFAPDHRYLNVQGLGMPSVQYARVPDTIRPHPNYASSKVNM